MFIVVRVEVWYIIPRVFQAYLHWGKCELTMHGVVVNFDAFGWDFRKIGHHKNPIPVLNMVVISSYPDFFDDIIKSSDFAIILEVQQRHFICYFRGYSNV